MHLITPLYGNYKVLTVLAFQTPLLFSLHLSFYISAFALLVHQGFGSALLAPPTQYAMRPLVPMHMEFHTMQHWVHI